MVKRIRLPKKDRTVPTVLATPNRQRNSTTPVAKAVKQKKQAIPRRPAAKSYSKWKPVSQQTLNYLTTLIDESISLTLYETQRKHTAECHYHLKHFKRKLLSGIKQLKVPSATGQDYETQPTHIAAMEEELAVSQEQLSTLDGKMEKLENILDRLQSETEKLQKDLDQHESRDQAVSWLDNSESGLDLAALPEGSRNLFNT